MRRPAARLAAVAWLAALLGGCATNVVGLPYTPGHAVTPVADAAVAVDPVLDALLLDRVLSEAVDRSLDKAALIAALRGGGAA